MVDPGLAMLTAWAQELRATDVAAIGLMLCSVSFGLIGLRLPSQCHYLWLATGTMLIGVWWGISRWLPIGQPLASPPYQLSFLLMLGGVCALWYGMLQHYLEQHHLLRRRLLATLVVLNLLAVAATVWARIRGWPVPRLALIFAVVGQAVPVALAGLFAARKEPRTGHALSALALLLVPVAGVYMAVTEGASMQLGHVAMVPVLAMSVAILPAAFIREQRRLAEQVRSCQEAEAALTRLNLELQVQSQTLASALHAAEAGARARTRFLALIGHEFRTPLSSLAGHLELLAREPHPAPQQSLLEAAALSLTDLDRLLNNLLMLSRIDREAEQLVAVATDLQAVLWERLAPWQTRAANKGLDFAVDLDSLPAAVHVDAGKLLNIVDELLSNAVKFTEQGAIRFSARLSAGEHRRLGIQVQDTGVGVAPDRVTTIFAPFEQGESGAIESRPHGGSGLGLSVAQYLVQCLGGRLAYAARDCGGSVLSFDIPVQAHGDDALACLPPGGTAVEPLDRSADATVAEPVLAGERVLVVDDNAVVRQMLVIMLRKLGAEPVPTLEAAGAIAALEQGGFAAVLMDISMPGMSDQEAARRIRAREAESGGLSTSVPIIGISAHTLPGDREQCEAAGMSAYLPKPFTMLQLRRSLQSVLG